MATTRILIAEDNELVLLTLEEQLRGLGYDVVGMAHSGSEAVMLSGRLFPDLIIMDFRMPEMDGAEATAHIQNIYAVPVIMLTAYADKETIRRVKEAGAIAYLVKPIQENDLPPAINIALERFKEIQDLKSKVTELEDTLESRKLIERAKGILMQRLRMSERDAYERLRQRARDKRVKMKEIAQSIIEAEELFGSSGH
jgi:two-component system, response regulator PdtaR